MDKNNLNLSKLIMTLQKNVISIIIWSIVGLCASIVLLVGFIEPKYSSTVDILVNQKASNEQVQYTTQQAALQAINTYKDIITKPIILTEVLSEVRKTDNRVKYPRFVLYYTLFFQGLQ